jgi:ankyrin repeat protein
MNRRLVGITSLWCGLAILIAFEGIAMGPGDQEKKEVSSQAENEAADQMLWQAALEGQVDVMAAAVEKGARVEAADGDGRTALMYAAFNGHEEAVQWLLDRRAAVDTRDNEGRTPLMFASSGPFPSTTQLLLDYGSNPNDADEAEGWTALMFAAGEGQLEVVRVLLKYGADPSALDADGDAAADHAAKKHHDEVAQTLRDAASSASEHN